MEKDIEKLRKFKPELSQKSRARVELRRAEIESSLALMRRLRVSLGLSQAEVAALLGVTQSNVSKIEMKGDPSLSILARMAEAKNKKLVLTLESDDGSVETIAI